MVKAYVEKLRFGTDEEKAAAALGVYNMTSFASAVSIDNPKAMTSYDKRVFGHANEEEDGGGDTEMRDSDPASSASRSPPESTATGEEQLGEVLNPQTTFNPKP